MTLLSATAGPGPLDATFVFDTDLVSADGSVEVAGEDCEITAVVGPTIVVTGPSLIMDGASYDLSFLVAVFVLGLSFDGPFTGTLE